jgi:peptide/nickel transport system permease protein
MFFALLGQSMATVWIAVLNIYIFSVKLGWLPSIGMGSLLHYILPVITLGYPLAAETTRIGRSGMIDTLGEDFITATYAKGIHPFEVQWKYAFKNAVCPVITLVGMRMGAFLAGAIVVETIFSWPGIGQLINSAVGNRDYQLVQSLLLVSATMFAVINLIIDIINSFIDPRIRLE